MTSNLDLGLPLQFMTQRGHTVPHTVVDTDGAQLQHRGLLSGLWGLKGWELRVLLGPSPGSPS